MRSLLENIRQRYAYILPALYFFAIFNVLLVIFYRYRTYGVMKEIFRTYGGISPGEYIALSLPWDAAAILILFLVLFVILTALAGLNRTLFSVPLALSAFVSLMSLLSIEFFRIFETAFQTRYLGEEHFTGIPEMLKSAFAEISVGFYPAALIAIALCWGSWYVIFRFRDSWDRLYEPLHRGLQIFFPALCLVLLVISFFRFDGSRYSAKARRLTMDDPVKTANLLREQSTNPLLNMLFSPSSYETGVVKSGNSSSGGFTFKFNTDSIESSKRYGRMSVIPRGKQYNIVLFFFESTHAPYINMKHNGKLVTPHWNRLMKNSIVYRNHYANHPLSANALFSILGSAYDLSTKDLAIKKHSNIPIKILPQILKERGYATFLVHTAGLEYAHQNIFLGSRSIDRILAEKELARVSSPYKKIVGWSFDERIMAGTAIDFVKENKGKPFMLIFMPVNPHHPYAIPDRSFNITGPIPNDPEDKKNEWLKYVNSLYYSDHVLGELINSFEKEGLAKDTLFFIFGDHGEAFGQHQGNYVHAFFVFEENVHVPFIIYNKDLFPEPIVQDKISRHIDILPTILDILKIPASSEMEGLSLLTAHKEQMVMLHTAWKDNIMGVRDGRWKYHYNFTQKSESLFDLSMDPGEKKNIAWEKPDIAARYREIVHRNYTYRDAYYETLLMRRPPAVGAMKQPGRAASSPAQ